MNTVLRILYVEDSEDDALLVLHQIEKGGYDIVYDLVDTAEKMKTALQEKSWNIILSDYNMPSFSGSDALILLNESGIDLPFIIVSGAIGEEIAVEAMKAGAHDYIMKDNLKRLLPAVERELRESRIRVERKLLEQKQRQAEAVLHLQSKALESAANSIIITDNRGTILWANNAFTQLTGYSHEEIIGKNHRLLNSGMQDEAFYTNLWQTITSGKVWHNELVNRRKDGALYTSEMTITPVLNGGGKITNFIAINQDITSRKKMEEELIERELRYREIFNNASDGLFLLEVTEDGRFLVIEANPAIEESTGIPKEMTIGKFINEGKPQKAFRQGITLLNRCVTAGTIIHEDVEIVLPTGYRSFFCSFIPLRNNSGRVDRIVAIARDVTERKLAETEHLATLRFFENMDRINQAINGQTNIEQMMSDVLDVVLLIFDCDRAFLLFPCDPESATWKIPMERNKPDWPGALLSGTDIPMDRDVADTFRILLNSEDPVKFGSGTAYPLPAEVANQFSIKSFIAMAIYPNTGKPWQFGLHQCSHDRVWTAEEERLLKVIGRRVSDALTTLLSHRQLKESEQKYKEIFDNVTDSIFVFDVTEDNRFRFTGLNDNSTKLCGVSEATAVGKFFEEVMPPEVVANTLPSFYSCVESGKVLQYEEEYIRSTSGQIFLFKTLIPVQGANDKICRLIVVTQNITERKLAERGMRESESKFSTVFRFGPIALAITRLKDNVFLDVNESFLHHINLRREEVVGRNFTEINFGISVENIEKAMEPLKKSGSIENFEYSFLDKNGETGYGLLSLALITINNEPCLLIQINIITERKKVENILRESEEKFSSVFRLSPAILTITRLKDNVLLEANDNFLQNQGVTQEEVLGQRYDELGFGISTESMEQFREATLKDGSVVNFEYQFLDKTGKPGYGLLSEALISINGEACLLNQSLIITDRKLAEEKLRESEERFRSLYENATIGIYRTSPDGKILLANPALVTMFGYTSFDEFTAKNLETDGFELAYERKKFIEQIATTGEVKGLESTWNCMNGSTLYIRESARAIRDANGEIMYYDGTIEDITEKIKQEEELSNYRLHLEELITERTRELSNVNKLLGHELERQKETELVIKRALENEKEVNELRTKFISTASHEFRTPLTTILSSAQLLGRYGKKWDDTKFKNHIEKIEEHVRYLVDIIDDVLIVSKADNQKLEFFPTEISLEHLCRNFIDDVASLLTPKHKLIYRTKLLREKYLIDAKILKYIITNLLTNSIKYSPDGGKIKFSVTEKTDQLVFVVADEGIGIPDDDQYFLFETFHRGINVGDIKGTGLGMSIVKRAVELHNGDIKFKSIQGKGTTFTVILPMSIT